MNHPVCLGHSKVIQIQNYFLDIEDDEEDDAAVVEGGTTTSPKMITGVVMNGLSSGIGLQDGNQAVEEGEEGTEPQKKKIGRLSYMTSDGGGS